MKKLDIFNEYFDDLSIEETKEFNGGHSIIYNAFYWLGHKIGAYRTIPDSFWEKGSLYGSDN